MPLQQLFRRCCGAETKLSALPPLCRDHGGQHLSPAGTPQSAVPTEEQGTLMRAEDVALLQTAASRVSAAGTRCPTRHPRLQQLLPTTDGGQSQPGTAHAIQPPLVLGAPGQPRLPEQHARGTSSPLRRRCTGAQPGPSGKGAGSGSTYSPPCQNTNVQLIIQLRAGFSKSHRQHGTVHTTRDNPRGAWASGD